MTTGARASRSRCRRRSMRPVRQRPVDDRLDRRQVSLPIRDEERVAPDPAFRRNEQAERWKPILIDKMLERHRRRMDGVIEVVDAFVVRRIDAERMQSGPDIARARQPRIARAGAASVPHRARSSDGSSHRERLERPRSTTAARRADRRRKFRNGVRTASRQAACSDRLMRTSFSFSIRSRATLLRWVSDKSRSAP